MSAPIDPVAVIATLKQAFNHRHTLPSEACDRLMGIIRQANDESLELIAGAGIKFASVLAQAEQQRRAKA